MRGMGVFGLFPVDKNGRAPSTSDVPVVPNTGGSDAGPCLGVWQHNEAGVVHEDISDRNIV